MEYALHFLIGCGGMAAGYIARHWCPHTRHQVMVGAALLAIESYATVQLVG